MSKKNKNWGQFAMNAALQNLNRSCREKKAFRSKDLADEIGNKFNQRTYECNKCGAFHLTSIKASKEKL